MEITRFDSKYIEECAKIAIDRYKDECLKVHELPNQDYKDLFCTMLAEMVNNELGVVAIDNDKVVGFISCYGPIDNFFSSNKGVYCPIHGHGTRNHDSKNIYSHMYCEAAKKWVSQGLVTHAITHYAHNKDAIDTFFVNGFGMRCIDAISTINNKKLEYVKNSDNLIYKEIDYKTLGDILLLKNSLVEHISSSPVFFTSERFDLQKLVKQSDRRKSRFFVVYDEEKAIGYVEITSSGENFTCDDKYTTNICGAYLDSQYRSKGIFQNLLAYMFNKLREEGTYKRVGVDCESINPNAYTFWSKYFTPYTYSVVRKIDNRLAK